MKISVLIPMYNENRIIAQTAATLSEYLSAHFSDYEILFCDDGSTDGCGDTVRALELPNVRVIGYDKNRGKGYAVRYAMLHADGDVRMFTDADLAYGTEVISRVFSEFQKQDGMQVCIGSRNLNKDGYEGYTVLRRVMSKVYIRLLCVAGGFRLSDSQCGCKAFSAEAAEKIFPKCEVDGFAFDFEAILWAVKMDLQIREIPVRVIRHGSSKVHVVKDTLKMLQDLRKMKKRIRRA